MKHIITCAALLCFLNLFPFRNYAQLLNEAPKNHNDFNYNFGPDAFESNVRLNEINTRAFRYFLKNFPTAENEKWFKIPKGFCVLFNADSILNKIFYNKKGVFLESVKSYTEQCLNGALKKMIHNLFPDFNIKTVTELFDGRLTSYEICMTNLKTTKIFQVNNYEITNVEELKN